MTNPEALRIPSKRNEILSITQDAGHLERAFSCIMYDGALTYRTNQHSNVKLLSVPNELELLALEEFKLAQQGYNEYKKLLFLKYGESHFVKQLLDEYSTNP
ncbi:MAG: hypothetical protein LBE12_05290 [Planctomycetaceae bacterium]|jgi:hypothetical protein|nr:hypothetical protein [Planctomycetaceae bacterium]